MTAAPAGTRPAPSSCTTPRPSAASRRNWSSRARSATCDIDLGIAVGSAAKTAAIHSAGCRCQTRVAVAGRKTGLIRADHSVALSLSMTHKAIGFDRAMPEADFDSLDLPATGTLPVGVPGASRQGGTRNRQAPRQPSPPHRTLTLGPRSG